jgi:hypothetical protein
MYLVKLSCLSCPVLKSFRKKAVFTTENRSYFLRYKNHDKNNKLLVLLPTSM